MHRLFFGNLLPGTLLFGCFRILSCLSAHDIGGVYLCSVNKNPRRKFVVKVLYTPALEDVATKENLRREFEISCKLIDPNLVHSDHFFQDSCFTAFTMEYISGGTLADYLERQEIAPIEDTIHILTQLCSGLHTIHSAGFVHRDIKPENVLLSDNLQVKIADFGIAAEACSARTKPLTGTPHYFSPEYIQSGIFDLRSDIYALGVIAYELTTGQYPFQKASLIEQLTESVKSDPLSPHCVNPDCPIELSTVAMRALQRIPENRYCSALEMKNDLEQISSVSQSMQRIISTSFSAAESPALRSQQLTSFAQKLL